MELVIAAVTVLGVPWLIWEGQRLPQVRTKILAVAPSLNCAIGSYSGSAGAGLHANINNIGAVRAHDLSLRFPTMGVVWNKTHLEGGDWARPQIAIPDNAGLRTTELSDPIACLTYRDEFENPYSLRIPLSQTLRDDGKFNLGTRGPGQVVKPKLSLRVLWRLRKQV